MSVFLWAIGIALAIGVFIFPKGSKPKPMLTANQAKLIRKREADKRKKEGRKGRWQWVDNNDTDEDFYGSIHNTVGVRQSYGVNNPDEI